MRKFGRALFLGDLLSFRAWRDSSMTSGCMTFDMSSHPGGHGRGYLSEYRPSPPPGCSVQRGDLEYLSLSFGLYMSLPMVGEALRVAATPERDLMVPWTKPSITTPWAPSGDDILHILEGLILGTGIDLNFPLMTISRNESRGPMATARVARAAHDGPHLIRDLGASE